MAYIGLSEAEFLQVHLSYSEYPAFKQAMIQKLIKRSKPLTIRRQDCKKIFLQSEEK